MIYAFLALILAGCSTLIAMDCAPMIAPKEANIVWTPTTDPHATEHTTSRGRLYKHHYATKVNAYTMHSCTHVHTVPTQ